MLAEYVCQNCEGVLSIDQKINTLKRKCGFCGKKKLIIKTGGKPDESEKHSETE